MRRSRLVPIAIVLGGIALFAALTGKMPREQAVRIVLGDAAPRVTEVHVRYAERPAPPAGGAADAGVEWLREASFHYPAGSAPRIISHEPRLSDGEYVVEIDVLGGEKPATIERRVTLAGGTLSLDVSQAIPK